MQRVLPKSIEQLSRMLASLPSIGPKTANRLTFYLLSRSDEELKEFARTLSSLKDSLTVCSRCFIVSETDPCPICSQNRGSDKVAVVEEPLDVIAMERARFDGIYHVLGGQISPLNNVGPDDLRIDELLERLGREVVKEVVLATDPSLEGEATALYIHEQIELQQKKGTIPTKLEVTRLARGLPVGGDLEYADELTLSRALEGRQAIGQNRDNG